MLTLQPPLFFSTRAASTELLFLLLDCLFWLEEFVCPRVKRVMAELVGWLRHGWGGGKGVGKQTYADADSEAVKLKQSCTA